jgi:hypothetical protein
MDRDEAAAIIHRMMRQLEEEDSCPKGAPRCDGCGRREPLQAYTRTTSDGGRETLYYCLECRTLAAIADTEDRAS